MQRYANMKFAFKSHDGRGFTRSDKMRNHVWRAQYLCALHACLELRPF